jgi:multiple sugar transport system substrate-binding protein
VKSRKLLSIALGVTTLAAAAACSGTGASGQHVTINWWTWDPNQAAAYEQCIPAFEKANPDITVKVSQYNVSDYFTKLTAGFVAGDAPDAFMNSVTYLQSYANQGQLLPLDSYIKQDNVDMSQYSIGTAAWKYTDGKQYALPMDWATAAIYYNEADLQAAGYTAQDVDDLSWNADNGGTFEQMVKHLTVDANGHRGDQPGFDPNNIATYGLSNLELASDALGQSGWGAVLETAGIDIQNKPNWPTQFNFANPELVKGVSRIRDLSNNDFSPQMNQFSTAASEQLGSGKVALAIDGTWSATAYSQLPGIKIGTAPMVAGPNGKRALITNSNGNNIWAGSKNTEQAWKWISYQESQTCQTKAATYNGSFLPSIKASTDALSQQEQTKGVDFSVFAGYVKNNELFPTPDYNNGAKITDTLVPMIQSYFTNKSGNDIWATLQQQSKTLLAAQQ